MNKPTGKLSVVLFLFAWGIFFAFWSVSMIKNGEFYDKGEHVHIRPDARPFYFWGVVFFTFLMGVFGLWRGIVELRVHLRRRKVDGAGTIQDLQRHMIKKGRRDSDAA